VGSGSGPPGATGPVGAGFGSAGGGPCWYAGMAGLGTTTSDVGAATGAAVVVDSTGAGATVVGTTTGATVAVGVESTGATN